MELLQSLTNYLNLNKVKNLESWAEDGSLKFSPSTPEQGFEMQYTANFEMSSIEMEPAKLFMLVVSWIHAFNSERETQGLPEPQFFSERLEGKHYDFGIKIEFIESMMLTPDPSGDWLVDSKPMKLISSFSQTESLDDHEILLVVDNYTQDDGVTT